MAKTVTTRRRSTSAPRGTTARQTIAAAPAPGRPPPRRPPPPAVGAGIGPRRRRRDAWTNDRPNSAVNTTSERDGRRHDERSEVKATPRPRPRRSRRRRLTGTPTRTMVSERTEAIHKGRAKTARPPQHPTPAVTHRTAALRVDGGLDRATADDRDEQPCETGQPREPASESRHPHRFGTRFGRSVGVRGTMRGS